ncbi:ferredoxin [Mycobacterium servetii]
MLSAMIAADVEGHPPPAVFDADEVGHCAVLAEEVSGDLEAQAADAARNCPEGAITLTG